MFHAQDTVVWPLKNVMMAEVAGVRSHGTAVHLGASSITFPTTHHGTSYYIDPQVEWGDPMPGYTGGTAYHAQWSTPHTRHAFPIGVFYSDPENLADYYAMGVNTLVAGYLVGSNAADYVAAMNAMGNTMDWWPTLGNLSAAELVATLTDEPDIAEQVVGYVLWDEPDLSATYVPPATLRAYVNGMHQRDSTRPIMLGFGKMAVRNQGFFGGPAGGSIQLLNEYWREWASIADVISCDDYTLSPGDDPYQTFGVWAYAAQVL